MFAKAYSSSPVLTQNIAEARKLVKQAGDVGKTITIGTTSQLAVYAGDTGAYQAAAQAIGLKVVLKSVSAQDWLRDALAVRRAQATSAMPSCAAYGRCRPPSAA